MGDARVGRRLRLLGHLFWRDDGKVLDSREFYELKGL